MSIKKMQVVCPPGVMTGGPEALHQLVHAARQQGLDARVVYLPQKKGVLAEPAVPYKIYDVKVDADLDDSATNLIVVPEDQTWRLRHFKRAERAIWWLSIDHYFGSIKQEQRKRLKHWLGLNRPFDLDRPDPKVWHLAQSEYARQFLVGKGLGRVQMLTDYLRDDFVAAVEQTAEKGARLRRVAFNPKKGLEQAQKVMDLAGKDIEFVRLENMRPDQVRDTLLTSMVYMDFGHHPGRDRIPREAAICGCSVITGRKGSAANEVDVPISHAYKLDEAAPDFAQQTVSMLTDILDAQEQHRPAFDAYRQVIAQQKAIFFGEVKALFQ